MKKFAYIIFAATLAAAAVSCTKELDNPAGSGGPEMVTFTATTAQTKTDIQGGHTVWSLDDKIRVFYNESSAEAKLKTGENTSSATFEAAVPDNVDYYAVYPAAITSSKKGADKLSVTIPQVQEGSFGCSHIAVAKGVNKAFAFANVNSFLKISLPEAGYKRIVVECPAGKPLSGSLSIDFQGGSPAVSLGTDGTPAVEIYSESGFPAGDVFISILPGVNHDKGLLLKYYDSDFKGSFYLDKALVSEISTIHSFGEFGVTGDYFVSLEGAGNKRGITAANAMDVAAFREFMTRPEDADKALAWAKALDGATIHLAAGTYDFQDSLLVAFPGVDDPINVSFVGDNAVITGNEGHRLLNVGVNANASFKNIKFENGLSFTSRNSPILINNGATASFEGCTFTKNANKKSDGTGYSTGGCIYADVGTELNFDNCEFTYNRGSYGATLLTKGKVTIKDSHFQYNDGSWPGSALYLDHEDAVCEVYNSVIEDNTVTSEEGKKPNGGAIQVVHGDLTMTGCSILRNSIPGRRGGAIRTENSSHAKLINCTVKENTADWGGAINVVDNSVFEIEGGLYQANYSKGGGCILTGSGTNAGVIIKDALFKENYVLKGGRYGGVIRHESNGELTILGTTFEGNYSVYNGEDEAFGAAVSISYDQNEAPVTIDGCSFIGNHSKSGGGVALSYQSKSGDAGSGWMKVSNTLFVGNYNEYTGSNNENYGRHAGAVRLGHDSTNSYFDNCTFIDNYTFAAGNETKSAYGGAVTFYADGMGYFNSCRFENNRATRGGAISVWNCKESGIFLNGCSFSGNWISDKKGTTIYFERAKYFGMNNCSFNDNTYTQSNGDHDACWVYVSGDTDKILEECVIGNCSLIGSPRTTASLDPLTGNELLYMEKMKSGKDYHLVNNIIVAGNGQNSWFVDDGKTYGYNNVYSVKAGSTSYTGSGDLAGKSKSDLGDLAWDQSSFVWSWNGSLAGHTGITGSAYSSAVAGGSSQFKAWLEEIGALDKDQLGNARGSGSWWPGAYQK